MAQEIFISYSRKDFDKVKAIKNEIDDTLGITCWMDLDGIESGDRFAKVIISAINSHDTFLFMLSPNSMASEYALDELEFARNKKKRVIIVYISSCEMTDEFSFRYSRFDTIEWDNPLQHKKLISNLTKWFPPKKHIDNTANIFSESEIYNSQIHVFIIYRNAISTASSVNEACEKMLHKLDVIHSDVDIMMNVLAYNHSSEWMYKEPIKIENFKWSPINASFGRNFGSALSKFSERIQNLEQNNRVRIFRKSLVLLISNGTSDDDIQKPLMDLLDNPSFLRANRYAINIEEEPDLDVLAKFTGKKKKVFDLAQNEEVKLEYLLERLMHMGLYAGSSFELEDDDWGNVNEIS